MDTNYEEQLSENDNNIYLERSTRVRELIGKPVRHFKGKTYLILNVATHTETQEEMVVYQALYDDYIVYVRPMSMFIEQCTKEQYYLYGQIMRFECIL